MVETLTSSSPNSYNMCWQVRAAGKSVGVFSLPAWYVHLWHLSLLCSRVFGFKYSFYGCVVSVDCDIVLVKEMMKMWHTPQMNGRVSNSVTGKNSWRVWWWRGLQSRKEMNSNNRNRVLGLWCSLNLLQTSKNKLFRRIWCLSRDWHTSVVLSIAKVRYVHNWILNRFYKYILQGTSSSSYLVQTEF